MQVLRCQPESGAVSVDQAPVALSRPRHEGHVSPLDPSALSRHLGTQDLQAPKVSTAGSVTLPLHHTIVAVYPNVHSKYVYHQGVVLGLQEELEEIIVTTLHASLLVAYCPVITPY